MANVDLNCEDYKRRSVTVSHGTLLHVRRRHPEMKSYVKDVCNALLDPNLVYFRERTRSYLFYRLGLLAGSMSRNYMVVVVRYTDSNDIVKTFYSTGRPAYGDSLVRYEERYVMKQDPFQICPRAIR